MKREARIIVRNSSRISLRAATERDFDVLARLRNDRAIQDSLLAVARPNSPARVRAWLERRAADDAGVFFVIVNAADDLALGFIQASGIDPLNRVAELGICLDVAGRGKGFGREAIGLLEKYLMQVFNVRKIWLRVSSNNTVAIALYHSSGFREAGTLKKHHFANGRFRDVLMMEKFLTKAKAYRE
jgi:RimJ/RimL family protein N-acetyltransferase